VADEPSRRRLNPWRLVALLALGWAIVVSLQLWWLQREPAEPIDVSREPEAPLELSLRQESWDRLPGWSEDRHGEALVALRRSCRRWALFPDDREVSPVEVGGRLAQWREVCREAERVEPADHEASRRYFEELFVPFRVLDGRMGVGLFTGYYEPLLRGSRRRQGPYRYPLYRAPGDIVQVDLGSFREDLAGRRVAGRLQGRRLVPYADRLEIESGFLAGRGLELLWVDDPIDAFFLQIQGSGRVDLAEGGTVRIGYAGQNGHAYTAIGRELIDRGELERSEVSMQSIRAWLEKNPEQRDELLAVNASYVFFRELPGEGPIGSQGVALTPRRSLAVDRSFLPMGVPVWLEARVPIPIEEVEPGGETERWWRRLLVAQDTGGAIRGPVRGDVFWGAGEEAADVAGRMKGRGRYWVLLPKEVAALRVAAAVGAPPSGP
jgi:membrane-bound lytic murein transglycosylase A